MVHSVMCYSEIYKNGIGDAPSLETVFNVLCQVQDLTSA